MQVQVNLFDETTEQIFARVYEEISRGGTAPPVVCAVRPYVNTMGRVRMAGGNLEIRLSNLVAGAPVVVREALAWILLAKMFRRKVPPHYVRHWRGYMNRKEVRRTMHLVRQERGRKYVSGPRGEHFDLEEIFADLNTKYFDGLMAQPDLGWSRGKARTLLGHFDPSHNAIILSRILDQTHVPRVAVEYVLLHEMLHLRFPVVHRGARRRVHTKEFREAEKKFERLKEARAALKLL